jgi:PAS domain S-box-containing protein
MSPLLKKSIFIFALIMITFLVIKTMSVFDIIEHDKIVDITEFICLISAIPSAYLLFSNLVDYNKKILDEKERIEEILSESSLISKTDSLGKIIEVNDLFCTISGYKRHELLGKDHNYLNSGKHSTEFWQNMYKSTVLYRSTWNEIVTNKSKSGEYYIVNSWIKAIFDSKGKHSGYLSVRQNITDLHNSLNSIKEKEEELRGVMNAINKSSSVIEFCTNGFIINANHNFLKLMEYSNLHEITGKHHSIFIDPSEINSREYNKFWKDLKEGKFKNLQVRRFTKTGKQVWLTVTYNPIFDSTGKLVKIIKIAIDNTELIDQKIDLERKNSYLEHAAKILRHDMHSGINTYIPRGISSLERRLKKFYLEHHMDSSEIEKLLGSSMKLIKEGLHHAQRVYIGVREFTNLVKKDSSLDKEYVNLFDTLKDYLKTTAYLSQVVISSNLGIERVNSSLFCTAIDNLIRNGLKYNDSDTKLVKIYRDNNQIIVEDNGRGMTKAEFDEYSKPYSRKINNKESGSGLGLNICLAIIKEHGWSIEIDENNSLGGTRLIILIDK